ncbi:MAG: ACT domain-containing protein [Limosilactobacillus pontis]|uniref:UPF0237 protein CK797_00050 n=1 Tax=Limosilactobacillus pontis TaxID=35787 RepID=A0A2J6NPI5_9LACO|nr:ACT domain-containing protein [Limosilactobacillus pontis]PMB83231.1 ACT domain-containing protein [Limosilactobacillus pontis]
MNAILTVIGKDQVGIIAQVSQVLAKHQVNILDVSQTLMKDNFVMMMLVAIPEGSNFNTISTALTKLGDQLQLEINMRNAKLYDAMHTI